jgi:hypothetical protein
MITTTLQRVAQDVPWRHMKTLSHLPVVGLGIELGYPACEYQEGMVITQAQNFKCQVVSTFGSFKLT